MPSEALSGPVAMRVDRLIHASNASEVKSSLEALREDAMDVDNVTFLSALASAVSPILSSLIRSSSTKSSSSSSSSSLLGAPIIEGGRVLALEFLVSVCGGEEVDDEKKTRSPVVERAVRQWLLSSSTGNEPKDDSSSSLSHPPVLHAALDCLEGENEDDAGNNDNNDEEEDDDDDPYPRILALRLLERAHAFVPGGTVNCVLSAPGAEGYHRVYHTLSDSRSEAVRHAGLHLLAEVARIGGPDLRRLLLFRDGYEAALRVALSSNPLVASVVRDGLDLCRSVLEEDVPDCPMFTGTVTVLGGCVRLLDGRFHRAIVSDPRVAEPRFEVGRGPSSSSLNQEDDLDQLLGTSTSTSTSDATSKYYTVPTTSEDETSVGLTVLDLLTEVLDRGGGRAIVRSQAPVTAVLVTLATYHCPADKVGRRPCRAAIPTEALQQAALVVLGRLLSVGGIDIDSSMSMPLSLYECYDDDDPTLPVDVRLVRVANHASRPTVASVARHALALGATDATADRMFLHALTPPLEDNETASSSSLRELLLRDAAHGRDPLATLTVLLSVGGDASKEVFLRLPYLSSSSSDDGGLLVDRLWERVNTLDSSSSTTTTTTTTNENDTDTHGGGGRQVLELWCVLCHNAPLSVVTHMMAHSHSLVLTSLLVERHEALAGLLLGLWLRVCADHGDTFREQGGWSWSGLKDLVRSYGVARYTALLDSLLRDDDNDDAYPKALTSSQERSDRQQRLSSMVSVTKGALVSSLSRTITTTHPTTTTTEAHNDQSDLLVSQQTELERLRAQVTDLRADLQRKEHRLRRNPPSVAEEALATAEETLAALQSEVDPLRQTSAETSAKLTQTEEELEALSQAYSTLEDEYRRAIANTQANTDTTNVATSPALVEGDTAQSQPQTAMAMASMEKELVTLREQVQAGDNWMSMAVERMNVMASENDRLQQLLAADGKDAVAAIHAEATERLQTENNQLRNELAQSQNQLQTQQLQHKLQLEQQQQQQQQQASVDHAQLEENSYLKKQLELYEQQLNEKDHKLQLQHDQLLDKEQELQVQQQLLTQKEQTIQLQQQQLQEKEQTLQQQQQQQQLPPAPPPQKQSKAQELEITRLQQQVDSLTSKLESSDRNLKQRDEDYQELRLQMLEVQQASAALATPAPSPQPDFDATVASRAIPRLEKRIEEVEAERDAFQRQRKEYEKRYREDMSRLRNHAEALEREKASSFQGALGSSAMERLERRVETLTEELREKDRLLEETKAAAQASTPEQTQPEPQPQHLEEVERLRAEAVEAQQWMANAYQHQQDMDGELRKLQEENGALQQQQQQEQEQLQELQGQLQQKEITLQQQREQLQEYQEQLQQKEITLQQQREQLQEYQEQLQQKEITLQQQREQLQQQTQSPVPEEDGSALQTLREENTSLKEEQERYREAVDTLKTRVVEYRDWTKTAQDRIRELEEERDGLERKCEDLQMEITSTSSLSAENATEGQELRDRVRALEEERDQWQSTTSTNATDLSLLEEERNRLRMDIRTWETRCKDSEAREGELRSELQRLQGEYDNLLNTVKVGKDRERSELGGRLSQLEEEKDELKRSLATMEVRCVDLEEQRRSMERECSLLQEDKEEMHKTITTLEIRCSDMDVERSDLVIEVDQLRGENDGLQRTVETVESRCGDMERNLCVLKEEREQMQQSLETMRIQCDEFGRLQAELHEGRNEMQDRIQVLQTKVAKAEDLQIQMDEVQSENDILQSDLDDLRLDMEELQKDHASQLEEMESKVTHAEAQGALRVETVTKEQLSALLLSLPPHSSMTMSTTTGEADSEIQSLPLDATIAELRRRLESHVDMGAQAKERISNLETDLETTKQGMKEKEESVQILTADVQELQGAIDSLQEKVTTLQTEQETTIQLLQALDKSIEGGSGSDKPKEDGDVVSEDAANDNGHSDEVGKSNTDTLVEITKSIIERLVNRCKDLEEVVDELTLQLEEKEEEIAAAELKVEECVTELTEDRQRTEEAVGRWRDTVQELEMELNETRLSVENLSNQLETQKQDAEMAISRWEDRCAALETHAEEQEKQLDNAEERVSTLEETVTELTENESSLKQLLEEASTRVQALTSDVEYGKARSEGERKELIAQIEANVERAMALELELDDTQSGRDEIMAKVKEYGDMLTLERQARVRTEESLRAETVRGKRLEEDLGNERQRKEDLANKKKDVEDTLKKERDHFREQSTQYKENKKLLEDRLNDAQKTVTDLQVTVGMLRGELRDTQDAVVSQKTDELGDRAVSVANEALRIQVSELRTELASTRENLRDEQKGRSNVEHELERLKYDLALFARSRDGGGAGVDGNNNSNNLPPIEGEIRKVAFRTADELFRKDREQMETLRTTVSQLLEQLNNAKESEAKAEERAVSLRRHAAMCEEEIREARKEIAFLNRALADQRTEQSKGLETLEGRIHDLEMERGQKSLQHAEEVELLRAELVQLGADKDAVTNALEDMERRVAAANIPSPPPPKGNPSSSSLSSLQEEVARLRISNAHLLAAAEEAAAKTERRIREAVAASAASSETDVIIERELRNAAERTCMQLEGRLDELLRTHNPNHTNHPNSFSSSTHSAEKAKAEALQRELEDARMALAAKEGSVEELTSKMTESQRKVEELDSMCLRLRRQLEDFSRGASYEASVASEFVRLRNERGDEGDPSNGLGPGPMVAGGVGSDAITTRMNGNDATHNGQAAPTSADTLYDTVMQLKAAAKTERTRYRELMQDHEELLGYLAKQDIELDHLRLALERVGGEAAVAEAEMEMEAAVAERIDEYDAAA